MFLMGAGMLVSRRFSNRVFDRLFGGSAFPDWYPNREAVEKGSRRVARITMPATLLLVGTSFLVGGFVRLFG
jgi:hypothetical protein